MNWNNGYVSDIAYLASFVDMQSPVHLDFTCLLNGVEPVALDGAFTYFELGFGQGLTANLLAASNPQGRFFAADFHPAHVAAAQELATEAGLENLILLENSFCELASGKVDLPQFDFITMHGVYTWISPENRRHIVDFIARYLKPGGIVYVSYNAMPGSGMQQPLQKLLREYSDGFPGTSRERIERARDFVQTLMDGEAGHFASTPALPVRWNEIRRQHPDYLAHEYMNRHWEPMYFADVARDFADAKLDFIGSARLPWAFPHCYLSAEQISLLASIPDAVLRETAKDYLRNTGFRLDVFVRGARQLTRGRREHWAGQFGLALTEIPERLADQASLLAPGTTTLHAQLPGEIVEALRAGPRTLAELAEQVCHAGTDGKELDAVMEVAALLVEVGHATPFCTVGKAADPASTHRMNRAVMQRSRAMPEFRALASPLTGSAIEISLVQRLAYRALDQLAPSSPAQEVLDRAWHIKQREQHTLLKGENERFDSEEEEHASLALAVEKILQQRVPLWRQLNILQSEESASLADEGKQLNGETNELE